MSLQAKRVPQGDIDEMESPKGISSHCDGVPQGDIDEIVRKYTEQLWHQIDERMARHGRLLESCMELLVSSSIGAPAPRSSSFGSELDMAVPLEAECLPGAANFVAIPTDKPADCRGKYRDRLPLGHGAENGQSGMNRQSAINVTADKQRRKSTQATARDLLKKHYKAAKTSKQVLTSRTAALRKMSESPLLLIVSSEKYELVSGLIILANCVSIAAQLQYITERACESGEEERLPMTDYSEIFFLLLFSGDLALRLAAYREDFLRVADWRWNVFDCIIVATALVQVIVRFATPSLASGSATSLRSVQLISRLHAFRAIRMLRFFRELRMMLRSVAGSFKMLMFAFLTFALLYFMMSVIFTNSVYAECIVHKTLSESQCDGLLTRFGTLSRAMLTFSMSTFGGVDWGDIYEVVEPLGYIYVFSYLFYLFFTLVGLANVISGIFVESAMQASQADRETQVRYQLRKKEASERDLILFFSEINLNGSGTIEKYELHRHLEDERAKAYFESMQLDMSEVDLVLALVDADGSGDIDVEEFIVGCEKLQGEARSLDFHIMQYEIQHWMDTWSDFAEAVEAQLHMIRETVSPSLRRTAQSIASSAQGNCTRDDLEIT